MAEAGIVLAAQDILAVVVAAQVVAEAVEVFKKMEIKYLTILERYMYNDKKCSDKGEVVSRV